MPEAAEGIDRHWVTRRRVAQEQRPPTFRGRLRLRNAASASVLMQRRRTAHILASQQRNTTIIPGSSNMRHECGMGGAYKVRDISGSNSLLRRSTTPVELSYADVSFCATGVGCPTMTG